MRTKKAKIYMNGIYIETVRDRETAELRIRHYMRMDRYEVETEHYAMPVNGYPVYEIR